jgi:MarC family membrane protein
MAALPNVEISCRSSVSAAVPARSIGSAGKIAGMSSREKGGAPVLRPTEAGARRPLALSRTGWHDGRLSGAPQRPMVADHLLHALVTIDPIALAPIFLALTSGMRPLERRQTAVRATITATATLFAFALVGHRLTGPLGISIPAFRLAGGLLLFWIAIEMVFERRDKRRAKSAGTALQDQPIDTVASPDNDDVRRLAVFPLAIPLIFDPGAISATILIASGPVEQIRALKDDRMTGDRSLFTVSRAISTLLPQLMGDAGLASGRPRNEDRDVPPTPESEQARRSARCTEILRRERKVPMRSIAGKFLMCVALTLISARSIAQMNSPFGQMGLPLTKVDYQEMAKAADPLLNDDALPIGTTRDWSNMKSGSRGTIKLLARLDKQYQGQSLTCRRLEYRLEVRERKGPYNVVLDRCKAADGTWKIH